MKKTIEELLESPYWIVDILPAQVPAESPGQYFAVEAYFLRERQVEEIKRKHINLVLKLNCYRDLSIAEEGVVNPSPEHLADEMGKRHLLILIGDSMIQSEPDETYLTVFHPDAQLLELIREIAASEGLFVWQPVS